MYTYHTCNHFPDAYTREENIAHYSEEKEQSYGQSLLSLSIDSKTKRAAAQPWLTFTWR